METPNRLARTGAVFYVLWGLVHVAGAAVQLITLRREGAAGLAALIATARAGGAAAQGSVPDAASAFMGMGAMNILSIGLLVTVIGITMNWRNSRLGYWLNLGIVGATDSALLAALLLPGVMAWSDGAIGLVLFAVAAAFATAGRMRSGVASLRAQPT